jgi:hypothetical protein
MRFEDHCAECARKLGSPFPEVHEWLDEFAGQKSYGMRHRKVRHHLAGIALTTQLFGSEAAEAARLHIIADLEGEGWSEGDHFPVDEKDYERMGFY